MAITRDFETNFQGAFNDINLVDFRIDSPMGYMTAKNLGPNDVSILASPGNDGNVMNFFEGAMGDLLANKSYKVRNWTVTVRLLRHSLDYCRGTYLIQEILNGNVTAVSLSLVNKNFGAGATDSSKNETLTATQAFLVSFAGLEAGAGASGDFEMTFKCSNAIYSSGEYTDWGSSNRDAPIPKDKSLTNTGIDEYTD